jgi:hypothetical protein
MVMTERRYKGLTFAFTPKNEQSYSMLVIGKCVEGRILVQEIRNIWVV